MKAFILYFGVVSFPPTTWVLAQSAQASQMAPDLTGPWMLFSGTTVATLATLLYRQFLKVQKDNEVLVQNSRDREKEMREETIPALLRNTMVLERIETLLENIDDTLKRSDGPGQVR